MTWIAPPVHRPEPPGVADERQGLEGFLEFHRATLLAKCSGLAGAQLGLRSVHPTSMSLIGLVRHLTDVERTWWRIRVDRQAVTPLYWTVSHDSDFDDVDPAGTAAEADYRSYLAEVAACRTVASSWQLDDTFELKADAILQIRWLYLHLIEEYARHNGHADLLREAIDGQTGE